jgi:hypothetical protein
MRDTYITVLEWIITHLNMIISVLNQTPCNLLLTWFWEQFSFHRPVNFPAMFCLLYRNSIKGKQLTCRPFHPKEKDKKRKEKREDTVPYLQKRRIRGRQRVIRQVVPPSQ